MRVCECWGLSLTGLDFEDVGVLLLDGLRHAAAGVAFVFVVGVLGHDVGEVKVPGQTHGHSFVLDDLSHRCRRTVKRRTRVGTQ